MRAYRGRSLALASAAAAFAGGVALAQTGSAIAVPPPPPIMAAPSSPPAQTPAQIQAPAQPSPPGLAQTQPPPVNADNGAATPATSAPPATMPVTNDWTPGKTAELGVLDRVDGGVANLTIPVGGQATSGDLQISVLACVMRPGNEVPDAAIYLNVQTTDSKSGPPIFHGWMVRSIPAAAVVGDASETLRVANCS